MRQELIQPTQPTGKIIIPSMEPTVTESLEIKSTLVKVTPVQAAKWLEVNTRNRRLTKARVQVIARDIREGRWQQRNVAIAFYIDGRLADGQHRLAAIVDAEKDCKCRIETGYPLDTKFDDNRVRKWSDDAFMNGEVTTIMLGAAVKILYSYANNIRGSEKVSPLELDETLAAFPTLRNSVALVHTYPPRLKSSAVAAFHLLTSLIRPKQEELAAAFFEGLQGGAGLDNGNAVLMLRERLLQMSEREWRGVRSHQAIIWNTILRGWELFQTGTVVARIHVKIDDKGFNEMPGISRDRVLGMIRKQRTLK